jgi:4-amino-4-deoxy-L-arabinose transferase-like glycosyltransferase
MLSHRPMENQPAPNLHSSRNKLARLLPWLLVLLVLLFVGFIRVRLLDMPLERDEGEYAYAGQLILQGIPPYELAYNMKLPGTYFAYAAGMAVFGQTIRGIHLTLIVANSLTIILMFLLGRKLFGVTAGLVACASYAIMSASPSVAGLAAHATHFVVLFAVPATLLLVKASETNRCRTIFFSGLLYGLAFLMKQQGVFFGVFGGAFLVWQTGRERKLFSADFTKKIFTFGLGMILPFALTCLGLALAGAFSEFWFWTFTYARSYVTSTPLSEGIRLLHVCLHDAFDLSIGFWLIMAVGLPCAIFSKNIRNRAVFVMLLYFCSFLGAAVGLYFRAHYFILMLPAFALIQGMAIVSMQQALQFRILKNVLKSLPVIFFTAVLAWVVFYQSQIYFQMSPVQASQNLYNWNPFIESLAVAGYIREHTTKGARIAVLGSEPQIYFYAQRHSATGYIYTYALMEAQPNALKMQHEMIREIETVRPEYLVYVSYGFSWIFHPDSNRTIIRWFDDYAGRFYEQVGVVQMNSIGETEYLWDGAAKNQKPAGQYITVYKRKPDLKTHNSKSD